MQDEHKSKKQLIDELAALRQRVAESENDVADRSVEKEALKETEERFKVIFDNLRDGLLLADREAKKFLMSNPATQRMLGYTAEELKQMGVADIHPEQDLPWVIERFEELGRRDIEIARDIPVRRKDGSVFYADVSSSFPMVFNRKEWLGAIFRDITDRKLSEEALHRAEENFRRSLEESPLGVRIVTIDGETIYANRAILNIYGYDSIEDLKTTPTKKRYTPESYAEFQIRRELRKQGEFDPSEYEISIVRRDGEVRHLLVLRKEVIWNSERQFQVIYQDISERRRMEEALRASETRYRIVADNTNDWEYWMSPEGRFLYISPSCQRITGYTASEFEVDPKLLFRTVHAGDLAQFEAHLEENQTTSVSGMEFRIIHRDGTTRWIGHVCQTIFDAQGRYLGRRASNRDITNRKQAEKALEESSQKLKFFAYSVAHDLKSPAIGVYGLAKRLSKHAQDVLDEKGRSYCDQILKVSEHIAALVDKINVYISTKEAPLSLETINIADTFHMLKDEFSAQLSIRRIDWLKPETRIEIKADRLCMLRAFRNFVDNSLKYGGERLSKIWTRYGESEDFHIFSFSDNGKGLKEEDSEKVFGAFQRNETSRGVEGAGLGLTIVKEIAERHGGKVWVEPRSKKGITFYLSISKTLE